MNEQEELVALMNYKFLEKGVCTTESCGMVYTDFDGATEQMQCNRCAEMERLYEKSEMVKEYWQSQCEKDRVVTRA